MVLRDMRPYILSGVKFKEGYIVKKLLLVVNPCAGQKKAKQYLLEMIDLLTRAGYTVLTHITTGQGDGENAVLRYEAEIDRVVCCGGDGTFSEVVSGTLKSGKDLPIGYIPAGSTNDFATSLHLKTDLLEAAKEAASDTFQRLDVGRFGNRYFSYVASFGAFTKTSYTTPQSMKNMLGHIAYILSGIQELSQLKAHTLRFELQNGTVLQGDYLFGAISNSTSVGGILTLDMNRVDMADGNFELLLIRFPKDLIELADCVRALQQKNYNHTMLTFLSTQSVKIIASPDMSWTLDGEYEPGHKEIEVKCLPHAIQIIKDPGSVVP